MGHLFSGWQDNVNVKSDQEDQMSCLLHSLELIYNFCGRAFVKSFAPCYDWALWAGGDDLPKSGLNSNLAPDIKPCWTPPPPFVHQPGHQATILAL